jgi:ferredoxin
MALRFTRNMHEPARSPQNEGTLEVNLGRCPQNHPCPSVPICPVGALRQQGFAAPEVDEDQCIACGRCVSSCPRGALKLA